MTQRINQRIRRLFAAPATREQVHFHVDRDGHAFVCDFDRCDSPSLTTNDLNPELGGNR